ncbi:MAG TPA: copper resistance protein CopC [Candidatus Binatia bacterium]|jgi:hypothetical protein
MKRHRVTLVILILVAAVVPSEVRGHAFPVRSEPRVGWTIPASPATVRIWFDSEIEPEFSSLSVYNSANRRVDRTNARVDPSDGTLLQVDLPPLPPGAYRVYWKVLAKDTHVTEGDYSFIVGEKAP